MFPYEREMFWMIAQKEEETVQEHVTVLKLKSQSCDYRTVTSSLIKDPIVLGCYNKTACEQLLREQDPTLEKGICICQGAEQEEPQVQSL